VVRNEGNVGVPKRQASRIEHDEWWLSEPAPEPSPQLEPVEPQRRRQERLEKLLALPCVEPRPALHSRLSQISAPTQFSIGNWKNGSCKYAEVARSRVTRGGSGPQRTWKTVRRVCHPSTVPAFTRITSGIECGIILGLDATASRRKLARQLEKLPVEKLTGSGQPSHHVITRETVIAAPCQPTVALTPAVLVLIVGLKDADKIGHAGLIPIFGHSRTLSIWRGLAPLPKPH
jgi:hypothetical protein